MKWGRSQLILKMIVLINRTPAIFPNIFDFPVRTFFILANSLLPFLGIDVFFPLRGGAEATFGAGMYILSAVKNFAT